MRSLKVAVVRQTFTVLSLPDSLIAEITEEKVNVTNSQLGEVLNGVVQFICNCSNFKLQLASKPFY